jgi:hypothetical protein
VLKIAKTEGGFDPAVNSQVSNITALGHIFEQRLVKSHVGWAAIPDMRWQKAQNRHKTPTAIDVAEIGTRNSRRKPAWFIMHLPSIS